MNVRLHENPTTGSASAVPNTLLQYISDAVIYTDLQLQVNYFNKKAEQIYGIDAADIIGHPISNLISYKYINSSRDQALKTLTETGNWQGKVIYTRNDEREVYLLATVVYMYDESGERIGLIATLKDITNEELISQKAMFYEQTIRRLEAERLKEIIQTQESERNQLGRELHDNINQILAVVKLQLEFALENYDEEKITVERCQSNIENVISEIRLLSHRLVLPRFAESSLKTELQKMIDMVRLQQPVTLKTSGLKEKLVPDNIKETLYRIVQEQLNNIVKHAKAGKAVITLQSDTSQVTMQIEDNGNGFDPTLCRNGVGITNILNRVESYHGTADIISAPGKGCRLSITIPLQQYP
jgi:two-component system sensor histidine kinase UhpB